ncbi:MAG: 30S ribosomal protein S8e [Desulfurococcales archaeon]|nr:30S ribosomal protein S8e [Desulfurococcales archaeon]
MAYYQGPDLRKPSGGKKRAHRKKRKYELGRVPTWTRIGEKDLRKGIRIRGGNIKIRLKKAAYANIVIKSKGEVRKAKIIGVEKTPSNPELARRGIITKGAIIRTEIGLARVTSRPGQDGVINAVLIEK